MPPQGFLVPAWDPTNYETTSTMPLMPFSASETPLHIDRAPPFLLKLSRFNHSQKRHLSVEEVAFQGIRPQVSEISPQSPLSPDPKSMKREEIVRKTKRTFPSSSITGTRPEGAFSRKLADLSP